MSAAVICVNKKKKQIKNVQERLVMFLRAGRWVYWYKFWRFLPSELHRVSFKVVETWRSKPRSSSSKFNPKSALWTTSVTSQEVDRGR